MLQVERIEHGYIRLLGDSLEYVPDKPQALRQLYQDLAELESSAEVTRPNLVIFVSEDGNSYRWRRSAMRGHRRSARPIQPHEVRNGNLSSREVSRRSRSRSRSRWVLRWDDFSVKNQFWQTGCCRGVWCVTSIPYHSISSVISTSCFQIDCKSPGAQR